MTNAEIIRILNDIADLLEIKGENVFKIRAYHKAAHSIELLPQQLDQLVREERLREVPGIGEAIEKKITELVTTGHLVYYENLLAEFPEGVCTLMEIPGIGPKKAVKLCRELNIKTVAELEAAIKEGKVADLERMGEKSAGNLLRQIESLQKKKSNQRIALGVAKPVAEALIDILRTRPGVRNLTTAGSLRRLRDTVGDIDIIGTADDPESVIRFFTAQPTVREITACGPTKGSVILNSGLKVDLRLVDHESFGSLLQHFTGSQNHNVKLRERARRLGLSLSEYGITDSNTGKMEKFLTEEAFYARQGLQYIPPEIREGGFEIIRAEEGTISRLIEPSDIRGDLHVHTDWSDGKASIEEMALAAKAAGREYIAITDHSHARGVARGLDADRLRAQIAEVKAVNKRIEGIRIFTGMEVDIMADGSLDMPDEILNELDIVIAAVHSSLSQEKEKITMRLVKAASNPAVDIIAHPTGRLILEREPSEIDMEMLLNAAAAHNTIVEINSMPDRLDLNDTNVFRARELGVMIAINTDAHRPDHFDVMPYGVGVARRGWCEAKDILNTKTADELLGFLSRRVAK